MTDLTVIFTLIFLAASLAIYGVYWVFVFNRRSTNIVNRRLDLAEKLDSSSAVLETLRRERGFRDETNPILRHCSDWLMQTGIVVQRSSLILVFAAVCLEDMVLQSTWALSPWWRQETLLAALGILAAIVLAWPWRRRTRASKRD